MSTTHKGSFVRDSYNNKKPVVENRPGYYTYWFPEDIFDEVIRIFPNTNKNRIRTHTINGDTYYALYFGISRSLRQREKNHICQKHTTRNIEMGFLSTLRQTLCGIFNVPMSEGEDVINKIIDRCYLEIEYTDTYDDARREELKQLNSQYQYPLNVQDNKTIDQDALKTLKNLRKMMRK